MTPNIYMGFMPTPKTSEELRREVIEEPLFDLEFPLIEELNECDEHVQDLWHDSQLLRVEL